MANAQESLSDTSSQKSVTDWLMHVISGKSPDDTEVPDLLGEEARPDAALPTMNGANRLAGANELPLQNGAGAVNGAGPINGSGLANGAGPTSVVPSQNGVGAAKASNGVVRLEEVREFSADDLCGPPAFGPVPMKKDEITADDLCWVPRRQEFETPKPVAKAAPAAEFQEMATPPNSEVNAALAAEASHIETVVDEVPLGLPDIERDAPAYEASGIPAYEPASTSAYEAPSTPAYEPAASAAYEAAATSGYEPAATSGYEPASTIGDWEPRKYVISTADILRERAPALIQQFPSVERAAAAPQPVVNEVSAKSVEPAPVEPAPQVMAVQSLAEAAPPMAVEPAMAAEPQRESVSVVPVAEPAPVDVFASAVPAEVVATPAVAQAEQVNSAPAEQSAVAAAITRDGMEPLAMAAAETSVPAPVVQVQAAAEVMPVQVQAAGEVMPVAQVQAVAEVMPVQVQAVAEVMPVQVQAAGEVMPNPQVKKEEAPAAKALVGEPKSNVISMAGEQVASAPRAKRITKAKRDQVVTIADICRDWVLEEMLEKTGASDEIDEENELQEELQDLVEGISPEPAGSVFAHEGIWGNPGRLEVAGQSESALAEQPEQSSALVASEGTTEVEEARPAVQSSGVKALLKLGSMLPWLARDFPVVESVNKPQSNALTQEVRDEVAGMRLVQNEIRSTVHDHSLQLKRVEEQLSRVRETLVEEASETADLVDSVKTTNRAVTMFGVGVCLLLLFMLGMLVFLIMHNR